jgi:CubicO group peptidase (beta-lactamase class C family)
VHADAIDDYLRTEMAARKIPGLAIAIVRAGRIERIANFGVADAENGAPVTDSSIFAIASLDKELTAAGVLKAEERGKLSLDEPVSKYLPPHSPFQGSRLGSCCAIPPDWRIPWRHWMRNAASSPIRPSSCSRPSSPQ